MFEIACSTVSHSLMLDLINLVLKVKRKIANSIVIFFQNLNSDA